MKKLFIVIAILTASFTQAQQEIKLDIFDALVLKTIEVSYEKYIDDTFSFGISALINSEKNSADLRYNEQRVLTPFFRHYFTSDSNWNFFGEGFFAFNFGEKKVINGATSTYEDYTDGALGVAVGMKYVSEGGFTVDLYGGAGRNLFSNNSYPVIPRVGVNVGWRF